jgi:hypothetical protein
VASEKQIAANKRNAEKSTGPRTQKGKARSRMNALRHGFNRVVADLPALENDCIASNDANSTIGAIHLRLRRIDAERAKILGTIDESLKPSRPEELYNVVRRLAALERHSRRSYSELTKYMGARNKGLSPPGRAG